VNGSVLRVAPLKLVVMSRFGGGGGGGGERQTFVGGIVPREIKLLPKQLAKLPQKKAKTVFKGLLQSAC